MRESKSRMPRHGSSSTKVYSVVLAALKASVSCVTGVSASMKRPQSWGPTPETRHRSKVAVLVYQVRWSVTHRKFAPLLLATWRLHGAQAQISVRGRGE